MAVNIGQFCTISYIEFLKLVLICIQSSKSSIAGNIYRGQLIAETVNRLEFCMVGNIQGLELVSAARKLNKRLVCGKV